LNQNEIGDLYLIGELTMKSRLLVIASLSFLIVVIYCNKSEPISPSQNEINQSKLIGIWVLQSLYSLTPSGYILNYDTLKFKDNRYSRINYVNIFPGFGSEIGTYQINSDSIEFRGVDYAIDSLHNVIDSQQILYYWRFVFDNDSTLEIINYPNTNCFLYKITN
jgi:hypothetical protein